MIVVSQDEMSFVDLDKVACVKVIPRNSFSFDILASQIYGSSVCLATYKSEEDAKKVLSNILAKRRSKWEVMFMPDRNDVENILALPVVNDKSCGPSVEHSCELCEWHTPAGAVMVCAFCTNGNCWEPKEE